MQAISTAHRTRSEELLGGEPSPITVGDVIGGKYTIDAIIGIGGMGVVAAATHAALGQRVAVKVMRTSRMNADTASRFLSEARAAVSLKSSHVAKVLDVGTLASGLPYMVMELLEGEDLGSKLEKRGAVPAAEAIEYILQACDAIAEAHALGIVHRDLKPENMFVTERRDGTPFVKVLDFGISKVTSSIEAAEAPASRRAVTHESTVMGSPMYMSPEQIRSAKHVDGRTDVWALGAILYELVAGYGAFWAPSVPDIFVKVLDKPAPRIEDALRDPPPGLAEVVARCLEKEREKRFESVDALAIALANLGAKPTTPTIPPWDRSVEIPIGGSGDEPAVVAPVSSPFAVSRGSEPSLSRRVAAETFVLPDRPASRARRNRILVAVAVVTLGGIAAGVAWHRGSDADGAAGASAAASASASASAAAAAPAARAAGNEPAPAADSAGAASPTAQAAASAAAPAPGEGSKRTTAAPRSRAVSANAGKNGDGASTRAPVSHDVTPSGTAATPRPAPTPTLHRTDW